MEKKHDGRTAGSVKASPRPPLDLHQRMKSPLSGGCKYECLGSNADFFYPICYVHTLRFNPTFQPPRDHGTPSISVDGKKR